MKYFDYNGYKIWKEQIMDLLKAFIQNLFQAALSNTVSKFIQTFDTICQACHFYTWERVAVEDNQVDDEGAVEDDIAPQGHVRRDGE